MKGIIKMRSDIYHLILQTLVYNRHLSRLHCVRSATTAKKNTLFPIFPTVALLAEAFLT